MLRWKRLRTLFLVVVVVVATSGCVGLGFGSLAPGAGGGDHWGTVYHHTMNGETAPPGYDFATSEPHGTANLGVELGYRGGVSSASIPGTAATLGYAAELHLDLVSHGLGLTASYGQESATFNKVDYVFGGLAAGGFAQMSLTGPLYLDLGISRMFSSVGVDGGETVDAPATRVSARLKLIAESLGVSLELRGTSADHAMVGAVDATWSSMSVLFEVFYVKL